MATTATYVGKVKNIGPQEVEKPIKTKPTKSGVMKRGKDLRVKGTKSK